MSLLSKMSIYTSPAYVTHHNTTTNSRYRYVHGPTISSFLRIALFHMSLTRRIFKWLYIYLSPSNFHPSICQLLRYVVCEKPLTYINSWKKVGFLTDWSYKKKTGWSYKKNIFPYFFTISNTLSYIVVKPMDQRCQHWKPHVKTYYGAIDICQLLRYFVCEKPLTYKFLKICRFYKMWSYKKIFSRISSLYLIYYHTSL